MQVPKDVPGVDKVCCCSEQYSNTSVLFEPLKTGLPVRLLDSFALEQVVWNTVYIPVMNVMGTTDVLLYPYIAVGTLDKVRAGSLTSGVTDMQPSGAPVASQSVFSFCVWSECCSWIASLKQ